MPFPDPGLPADPIAAAANPQRGASAEQENAFTNEGAPPLGVVGTDLPVGGESVIDDRRAEGADLPKDQPQPRRPFQR